MVEISSDSHPPVCRIMDFGKFKYEKRKVTSKKTQKATSTKEIKLRPRIEDHDYQFKKRNAEQFLKSGFKVKIILVLRGRELQYKEEAVKILEKFREEVSELGTSKEEIKMEGRNCSIILTSTHKVK